MKILIQEKVIDSNKEPIALVFRDKRHLREVLGNLTSILHSNPTLNSGIRAYIEYPDGTTIEEVESFIMPLREARTYEGLEDTVEYMRSKRVDNQEQSGIPSYQHTPPPPPRPPNNNNNLKDYALGYLKMLVDSIEKDEISLDSIQLPDMGRDHTMKKELKIEFYEHDK